MKKLALIVLAALTWAACKQTTGSENAALKDKASIAAVDSLNIAFDDAWNKKDSNAVVNMLTDDVILISGRGIMKGKDQVAKQFVKQQMPVTSNLKSQSEKHDASGDLGYQTGTWSLTVNIPGQTPFESTGNYNFVCKKEKDGAWKFTVLSLEDHDPQDMAAK